MFSLFKKDPVKKLKNKRTQLLRKSVDVQRSGDLKAYARLMEEVDKLDKEIESLASK